MGEETQSALLKDKAASTLRVDRQTCVSHQTVRWAETEDSWSLALVRW